MRYSYTLANSRLDVSELNSFLEKGRLESLPYKCEKCKEKFSNKKVLKEHLYKAHSY